MAALIPVQCLLVVYFKDCDFLIEIKPAQQMLGIHLCRLQEQRQLSKKLDSKCSVKAPLWLCASY